jgi:hypothetical protein
MQARIAATFVNAFCKEKWPDDWLGMAPQAFETYAVSGVFSTIASGTHKYIPAEQLSAALGLPYGAGIFGYWLFQDGSCVLLTCANGLAVWDGKGEAKFVGYKKPEAVQ